MSALTDSFGYYGRRGQLEPSQWAARAFDRLVTFVIVLVLVFAGAVSGYSLWDAFNLANGGTKLNKPTDAESFAQLRAINPDVIAWLTVDNTGIDYAVVQGKDNFEYLNKDAAGEYSSSGSLFLDKDCDPEFREPYEVIMGHHMQYSKMFGDLDKFLDKDFFDQNKTATLMLPDRTLQLEVVSILKADAYDATIFGMPMTDSPISSVTDYIDQNAIHRREGEYSADDQLVALSTCASSGVNTRTVLMCKVVGETPANDATS